MNRWKILLALVTPLTLSMGTVDANADDLYPEEATPATEAPATAEVAEPAPAVGLVPTANFFTRYELREGYSDIGRVGGRFGEGDAFYYRARFGLSTTPIDVGHNKQATILFEPQSSGVWGGPRAGAVDRNTVGDSALGIHQAKIRISKDKSWIDVGRFEMAYGEHVVIGTLGWHQAARSFDGARAHHKLGEGYVDVIFTQLVEDTGDGAPLGGGDNYFGGVYAGLGPMLGDMDLDVYLLSNVLPRTTEAGELSAQLTLGSRIKKQMGSLDIRAEAGVQTYASGPEGFAWHGLAEVGAKLGGATRLAVQGFAASGDDPDTPDQEGWAQLFPTTHKFMGWMDIMGQRTNVMGGILRGRHKLNDTDLGADVHFFMRPETPDMVDAYTGIELDVFAKHPLGKGLFGKAGYSLFAPNDSGPLGGNGDLVHYVELTLGFTIK